MADQDVEVYIELKVKCFGNPEKVRAEALRSVARAVHNMSYKNAELRLFDCAVIQPWLRYDPMGDDMGNHEGHDSALVPADRDPLHTEDYYNGERSSDG